MNGWLPDGPGPRAGLGSWLDADLADVTGHIVLRWVGRDHIPGVAAGALLVVEGTVHGSHGRLVVLNPLYRFSAAMGPVTGGP